jgi:hypothetical protein
MEPKTNGEAGSRLLEEVHPDVVLGRHWGLHQPLPPSFMSCLKGRCIASTGPPGHLSGIVGLGLGMWK